MKNQSIIGHRHYMGIQQFCANCKRIRKLYGEVDRFDGIAEGDIKGFWVLSPALFSNCSGHSWRKV